MAVRKIKLKENNANSNYVEIDYYVRYMNNSFDKDINTIKKYISSLESLKDNILNILDELNANDNDTYVNYKLNILDETVSALNQSRGLIDNAELKAQKFIGKD